MKKLGKVLALIGDLAPGALLVVAGLSVGIGGVTGTLWH